MDDTKARKLYAKVAAGGSSQKTTPPSTTFEKSEQEDASPSRLGTALTPDVPPFEISQPSTTGATILEAPTAVRPPVSPNKEVTCLAWGQRTCQHSDVDCPFAHHLFPVIVERAAEQGYRRQRCRHEECWWPRDVCGFSHEKDINSSKVAQIDCLVQMRGWHATLTYNCAQCAETFGSVDAVVGHRKMSHVGLTFPVPLILPESRPGPSSSTMKTKASSQPKKKPWESDDWRKKGE